LGHLDVILLAFIHFIFFCEKITSISLVLLTDLKERKRFVLAYLSASGNESLQITLMLEDCIAL